MNATVTDAPRSTGASLTKSSANPEIGCVVMASGLSRRFGSNKLLAEFGGKPLLCRILDTTADFPRRIVVTRHPEVEALCRQAGVPVLLHALPHRSDTVRLGLEALGSGLSGCLFCPADQPLLRADTLLGMAQAAADAPDRILRLASGAEVGAPVLFPRWAFPELLSLPEGQGGSAVMKRYPDRILHFPAQSPLELRDADTPDALEALRQYLTHIPTQADSI